MWHFFTITAQLTLQQCLQHILNIYIRYCLQLHCPVHWLCCLYMLSFSQCDIFPKLLYNSLYNNVYSISSTYTCGTVYNYNYPVCWLFCLHMLSFSQCEYFSTHYCTIVYMTMFTFNLLCLHDVLFTITLYSILSVLFTYAVLFTMWYFSTITAQLTLQQCLQHILNIYIRYCLQLHYPVYWLCCLYMLPLHNVTFFHNHCTIDSTTMSTAYPQRIHIVLFPTTPHSILALLFIYAFLFTMWYFSTMTAQFTLQQCLQHILNIYLQYCLQLLSPVYCMCCLHMLSFSQCDIFPQLLHNSLYNNVYSISSTYTYSTVYNYTTQYTVCAFTYASFSQCDIISQSLPNSLYNNVYSISSTYTYNTIYNYTTQYTNCAVYMYFPFHNVNIFPQLLDNWLYNNVYSISSTYTYGIVYNYTAQYTGFAVYICFPFHNVIFFQNYCTIHSTTMFTAYPQHIHAVLFTITLPSMLTFLFTYAFLFTMWIFFHTLLYNCLYDNVYIQSSLFTCCTVYNYSRQYTISAVYICCPFHNVIFFHNHCTIDSTTMSTAYPQHIHTVLFTITLPSILTLLFIYASFTQSDIFSQSLHNWLYNNVYSISATYTYSTVCNYSPQYTGFAVYICFPFHNVIFFHNDCTIHSTTMFTAYSQHIHTVLFTITLPSILTVVFRYADLFTMWYFSTMTAQLTLQQCLQHIRNIYI